MQDEAKTKSQLITEIAELRRRISVLEASEAACLRMESALRQARDDLEQKVKDRTGKLGRAVEDLKHEIKERKRVEAALKESEEYYRNLFEGSPTAYWLQDFSKIKRYLDQLRASGVDDFKIFFEKNPDEVSRLLNLVKIVCVNQAAVELYKGDSKDDLLKGLNRFKPEMGDRDFMKQLISLAEGGRVYESETTNINLKGEVIYIYLRKAVVTGHEKDFSRVMVAVTDLTERKQAEEALKNAHDELERRVAERTKELVIVNKQLRREIEERKQAEEALKKSEERYRLIFNRSPLGVMHFDQNGVIVDCNEKFLELVGSSREAVIGFNMLESLDDESMRSAVLRALSGKIGYYEGDYHSVTGNKRTAMRAIYSRITSGTGKFLGAVGIFEDITERKRAEKHIHNLSQELMKAQESERQKIARELHDRVAQDLSTLKIGLETLFTHGASVLPEIRQRVSEFSQMLQATIKGVRDLSYDLRPPGLDQLGLVRTVFQYCKDFADNSGVDVEFSSAGMEDLRLDFDTEINLYRVLQESLCNIKKHAEARHVTIRLVASFPNIILRVEDDGKGFDVKGRLVAALGEKRLGLCGMKERISLLNGKMSLQSRPKGGTKILIEVPYKETKSGPEETDMGH